MLRQVRLARVSEVLQPIGISVLRYGTVLILLFFGLAKWTSAEAAGIQPMASHSPFLGWMYLVMSSQRASEFVGVIELSIATMIVLRRWLPALSALGSALGVVMFLVTISFLVTTPGLDDSGKGFILKDIFLLGGCLVTTSEALRAYTKRSSAAIFPDNASGPVYS